MRSFRVEKSAEGYALKEIWSRPDISFYLSSPVVASGRLFGFSVQKKGQVVCLDPASGRTIWEGPGQSGDNVALVAAGGFILALTDGADLIVLSAGASRYEPVATYRVARSPTWAHPAPGPTGILIKDKESLALWSWEGVKEPAASR